MLAQESKIVPEFTLDVNELLRVEAFIALKSLPRRGVEIGGFLIAASSENSTPLANAVEFISIEHLYGPSYRPSPADLKHFEQRAQLIRAQPGKQVLAFFRSCTREDVLPQPEDLAIVRDVLSEANFIVLVKPSRSGNCTVRVFTAEHAELVSEFELRMSLDAFIEPEPEPEVEPARLPVLHQPLLETIAPTPAKRGKPWLRYAGLTAASLGLLGAASLLIRIYVALPPHPQIHTAPAPDLGLRVENRGTNFRVTWNRDQPALRNAQATLIIDDGRNSRTLPIDQAQLASGSLVYVTDAADLTFHLWALGPNGPESETVRVVVAKPMSPPEPPKVVPAAHPELSITPVVRSWPAIALRPGVYRPAFPLHRITPTLHPSSVSKSAVVQIAIRIDSKGRVVQAREIDPVPAPVSLSAPALDASQQWVFEPARKNGRDVPSEYKIVYWFQPASRTSSATPRPALTPSLR